METAPQCTQQSVEMTLYSLAGDLLHTLRIEPPFYRAVDILKRIRGSAAEPKFNALVLDSRRLPPEATISVGTQDILCTLVAVDLQQLTSEESTAADLKDLGYTARQLRHAGYSIKKLKGAGYSSLGLLDAGYSHKELTRNGISAHAAKANGCTAEHLKDAGYSVQECWNAGFSLAETDETGYFFHGAEKHSSIQEF